MNLRTSSPWPSPPSQMEERAAEGRKMRRLGSWSQFTSMLWRSGLPMILGSLPSRMCGALLGITFSIQALGAGRTEFWAGSRITGSAEPPAPYLSERAFPELRFAEPIEMIPFPDDRRVVIAELKGKLFLLDPNQANPQTELLADFKAIHPDLSNFYGIAFHPGFATNRLVYVCYVQKDGDPAGSKVASFRISKGATPKIENDSEEVLLTFLGGGHNGGSMHFGNDGMLYISTGDGRGPDPPDDLNTGQDLSDLLSSILRIDVNRRDPGRNYSIPKDNPFIDLPGVRGEVWSFGYRNPWRMSFDRATGDLWVGDVGWELWEMIYRVQRGGNYGWSVMEGKQWVKPGGKLGPSPILPPTAIHPHSEAASITGGYVYRGRKLPKLQGSYVYGDWETGKIWSLRHDQGAVKSLLEIVDTTNKVVAFGEDHSGELYYLDSASGTVHRFVENPRSGQPSNYPRRLSETGLFRDLKTMSPVQGVFGFSPGTPLWRDGASAQRIVGIPGSGAVIWTNNAWVLPKDSVWAKTYSMDVLQQDGKSQSRRIETQLLHFTGESWNAYTYEWSDDQTDAHLVSRSGKEKTFRIHDPSVRGGETDLTYRFHSQAECFRCHNPWAGTLLGFHPSQMSVGESHDRLARLGLLASSLPQSQSTKVGEQGRGALEEKARKYLHANCSHCHREHGGGSVLMFLNLEMALDKCGVVDAKPAQGAFGIQEARIVAPGDPYRSVLYYRVSKTGKGHMPYLGSSRIDYGGTELLRNWILSLPRGNSAQSSLPENSLEKIRNTDAGNEAILDRLLSDPGSALKLADAAAEWPAATANRVVTRGLASQNPLVRELFERFLPAEMRVKTLGIDFPDDMVLGLRGDALRGRKLFFQEGAAQCSSCHRVQSEGKMFGPDLSHIGSKYTPAQLLEHLRFPSRAIDPAYSGYTVETKKDDVLSGLLTARLDTSVTLQMQTGESKTIPRAEIIKIEVQKLSLMPEGLLQGLTAQQASDLIEFLSDLK